MNQRTHRLRNGVWASLARLLLVIALAITSLPGAMIATPVQAANDNDGLDLVIPKDTVTYTDGDPGVILAPDLTLAGKVTKISGARVTITDNFDPQVDLLTIEDQKTREGKIYQLSWKYDQEKGILTISGESPIVNYEKALRKVVFKTTRTPGKETRSVVFTIGEQTLFFPGNGHYYEFVSARQIKWSNAKQSAEKMKLYGLQGYLATITSAEENAFAAAKLQGVGWIGSSDAAQEGTWQWVTGPEAGTTFWNGNASGKAATGQYANWNRGEPNNSGDEDYGHMIFNTSIGPRGSWNDLKDAGGGGAYTPLGFVVEYGGTPGDPTPKLSGVVNVNVQEKVVTPAPFTGISEDFKCSTAYGWTLAGSAYLTDGRIAGDANCNGWLRLTDNANSQAGYAIYNQPFPSTDHVVVRFKYAAYGGNGADGITFFLLDGKTDKPLIGAKGGALGYSWRGKNEPGLTNAYVGIGIDEWGNFSDKGHGGSGPGRKPHSITIRGSGNGIQGYNYLTHVQLTNAPYKTNIDGVTRDKAREVEMSIIENKATVKIDFQDGKGFQTIIKDFDLNIKGQAPLPPTFKMGFSGGTGGSKNVHEIRGLSVKKPAELVMQVTDVSPSNAKGGDQVTFKVIVTNKGPNAATGAKIVSTIPTGLTGASWTCTATDGSACGAASGSGNINTTATLLKNGVVTYLVTAQIVAEPTKPIKVTGNVTPPSDITNIGENDSKVDERINVVPTKLELVTEGELKEGTGKGSSLGYLKVTDPDEEDQATRTYKFELVSGDGADDNGSFEIDGNRLKAKVTLTKLRYSVRVRVTDELGGTREFIIIIILVSVNKAPTNITISGSSVNEDKAAGTDVGTLTAVDGDSGDTHTWTLVSNPGNKFKITGNKLQVNGTLDYETQKSYSLGIKVTDKGGLTYTKTIVITIVNVVEKATIDSGGTPIKVIEDAPLTFTPKQFTDRFKNPEGKGLATIKITSLPKHGKLIYNTPPDKTLASGDLPFEILITNIGKLRYVPNANYTGSDSCTWKGNDGDNDSDEGTMNFLVDNVNDNPTVSGGDTVSVDEDANPDKALGKDIFTGRYTDPDGDPLAVIRIVALPKNGSLIHSTPDKTLAAGDLPYDVPVKDVEDGKLIYKPNTNFAGDDGFGWKGGDGKLFAEGGAQLKLKVNNSNDAPTGVALSKTNVDENVPVGTVIGTLSATDADTGDTFTYALVTGDGDTNNGSFEIAGNKLKTKATIDFDPPNSQKFFSIRVQVTDKSGATFAKPITITVNDISPANEQSGKFSIDGDTLSVAENVAGGKITIRVVRASNTNNNAVTVDVAIEDVTTGAADHGTPIPATLSWANGEGGAKTTDITIADNGAAQGPKQFKVKISNPTGGATLDLVTEMLVTIEDDEEAGIEFTDPVTTGVEPDSGTPETVIAVIKRAGTGKGTLAMQVDLDTPAGTATGGDMTSNDHDYNNTSFPIAVNFADKETVKEVKIPIRGDKVFEQDETINLKVVVPAATSTMTTGEQTKATFVIANNDDPITGTLSFDADTATVPEVGGSATFTVTRTGGSDGAPEVSIGLEAVTPAGGNADGIATLETNPTTLKWNAGDTAPKTFKVTVKDNNVAGQQQVRLVLKDPKNGPTLAGSTIMTVTVTDDESGGAYLTSGEYRINEGNATNSPVIATVKRMGKKGTLTASIVKTGGTAVAGTDYTDNFPLTVVLNDGEESKDVTLPILGNSSFSREDKTITYELTKTAEYTLGNQTKATLVILNDDEPVPGTLSFDNAGAKVAESAGTLPIKVTRSGGSDGMVTATIGIQPTTPAAEGVVSYPAGKNVLTWNDGEAGAKELTLTINDDATFNPARVIQVTLQGIEGGATPGVYATKTLTMTENDKPLPPYGISAIQTNDNPLEIGLTWGYSDTDNIQGFVIYTDPKGTPQQVGTVKLSGTEPFTYVHVHTYGAPEGKPIVYGVKAYYGTQLSDVGTDGTTTITPTTYVPLPKEPVANQNKGGDGEPITIDVSWTPEDKDKVEKYDVYKGDAEEPIKSIPASDITGTEPYTITDDDSGLACSKSYNYRIRAVGKDGSTAKETLISVDTNPCSLPVLEASLSGPSTAKAGDPIEYTLTISNTGFGDALDITAFVALPEGGKFASATGGGKQYDNNVVWDLNYLKPGTQTSVKYTVSANGDLTTSSYGSIGYGTLKDKVVVDNDTPVTTNITSPVPDADVCMQGIVTSTTSLNLISTSYVSAVAGEQPNYVADDDAPQSTKGTAMPLVTSRPALPTGTALMAAVQNARTAATPDELTNANAGPMLDEQASGNGSISGRVLAVDGTPVEYAEVWALWYFQLDADANFAAGKFTYAITNKKGEFTLRGLDEKASWGLLAYPPLPSVGVAPYPNYLADLDFTIVDLYATPGSATVSKPFALYPTQIQGTFMLEDQPTQGLDLTQFFVDKLDAQGNVDTRTKSVLVVTEEDYPEQGLETGRYRIGNLEPGDYQIRFEDFDGDYAKEYVVPAPIKFTVETKDGFKDLGTTTIKKAVKFINGTVTAGGTGVASALVRAVRTDGVNDAKQATTGSDGSYSIPVTGGTWNVLPSVAGERSSDWIYAGTSKNVTFSGAADAAETQQASFTAMKVQSFIEGTIVRPDGTALTFDSNDRDDVAIEVWNVDLDLTYRVYLNKDGTFKVPAVNGYHIVTVWVNPIRNSTLSGEAIQPFAVSSSSVNLGNVSLVRRSGVIEGLVTNLAGTEGAGFIMVDISEAGGRWFTTMTDAYGNYNIAVPPGYWQVRPRLNVDRDGYVFEGDTQTVLVNGTNREMTVPFTMTQATKFISGTFVNEAGRGELMNALLFLTRKGSGKRIGTMAVTDGFYRMRVPDDCTDCQLHAEVLENTHYSILTTDVQSVSSSSGQVNFTVEYNTIVLSGSIIDPTTGQAVTGITGKVFLTSKDSKIPSLTTHIQPDGKFTFTHVGKGRFSLSYELDREAGKALAGGKYMPTPAAAYEITISGTSTTVTRDITLESATSFGVTVKSGTATINYPVFVTCTYSGTTSVRGARLSTADDPMYRTEECVPSTTTPGTVECAKRDAVGGSTLNLFSRVSASAAEATLSNSLSPIDCTLDFGDAPVNQGMITTYINPKSTQVPTDTSKGVNVDARQRSLYIVGRVLDENGNPVKDQSVDVTASSEGDDGQVVTVRSDANGCYQAYVAPSSKPWKIRAEAEKDDTYYKDEETQSPPAATTGIVKGPTLQLEPQDKDTGTGTGTDPGTGTSDAKAGKPLPTEREAFDPGEGISAELPASSRASACGAHTVKVLVPADAVPTNSANVSLSIKDVQAPNTGFTTKIDRAYEVLLVEVDTKRAINDPFRKEITIKLPYWDETLAEMGVTVEDIRVADYSFESNVWTPVENFTVDTTCKHVLAKVSEGTEGIAIVVPAAQVSNATGIYLPMVSKP